MRSEAEYVADELGVVDPSTNPSVGGTYTGADPFGLWWSARPLEGEPPRPAGLEEIPTTVTVLSGRSELASARIRRRWVAAGVEVAEVRDAGLVGLLCLPAGAGPFPAVLVVSGSMGGLAGADTRAGLLASHGIAALALAYFGVEGRPAGLVDIPLEDLHHGLTWLGAHPRVAGRVGVFGSSRGGELALLLGATFPEVGCVVAAAPSCVVWAGVAEARPHAAAWTLGGVPVAIMKHWNEELLAEVYAEEPVRLERLFGEVLSDDVARRLAEIPVEKVAGPVLLISGEDDALWPSWRMGRILERRAREHGLRHQLTHLHYPAAGHLCAGPPGMPVPSTYTILGRRHLMGGTARGNAAAAADSWNATLQFLWLSLTVGQSTP